MAIVIALGNDLRTIRETEPNANLNTHPVVRLYIEQLCHLNRCGLPSDYKENNYSDAYDTVVNRALGRETAPETATAATTATEVQAHVL